MKQFLLTCFLFTSLIANRETCPIPPTTVAVEPLGLLAGCVDVATGAYIGSTVEVTVNCHEPISLYRQLVSSGDGKGSTSFWQLGKEYLDFKAKRHAKGKDSRFRIIGEAGDVIEYIVRGPKDWGFQHRGVPFFLEVDPDQLISNTSYGEISGRTNPRNNNLRYSAVAPEHAHYGQDAFTLHKGDGEVRIYTHGRKRWSDYRSWKKGENKEPKQETFLLREVIRLNGNRIFYSYDGNDQLIAIRSANRDGSHTFGWIQIQHERSEKIVTTSDGQTVRIHMETFSDPTNSKKKKTLPSFIVHSDGIMEGFRYARGKDKLALDAQSVQRRCFLKLEDHRFKNSQKIDCLRKTISAPIGEGGAFENLYSLEVGGGIYHRVEIEGGRILYTVRGGQIESMMRHNQGNTLPVSSLFQTWSPEGDLGSRRVTKYCVPYDFTDSVEEAFHYDKRHNVVERILIGSLTGRIARPLRDRELREQVKTSYTYGDFNLPLSEEKGAVRIVNDYRPGTDLLIVRKIYENGELREEIALDYDKNAALISKIHSQHRLSHFH
ncbi:MAG: hypothetical protein JSR80_07515 [Verrucomicrobia bacterium]|nr:hypothetical protein [Verrucomicrobiota bacterium]